MRSASFRGLIERQKNQAARPRAKREPAAPERLRATPGAPTKPEYPISIHIYLIDNVKVDIVNYKYQWLDEPLAEDGLLLAGMRDIAAMKVAAIVGRGTKKDFIDLYFLLKKYSLRQILDFYMEKYPDGSLFIALKSLCYFEDAEPDPMPYMFETDDWDTMKTCILEAVSSL